MSGLLLQGEKKSALWRSLNLPLLKLGSLIQTLKQRNHGCGLRTTESIRNCPASLGRCKNKLYLLSLPLLSAATENLDQTLFLARAEK